MPLPSLSVVLWRALFRYLPLWRTNTTAGATMTDGRERRGPLQLLLALFRVEHEPEPPRLSKEELGAAAVRMVIPSDRAMLCLDCDVIYEARDTQRCPSCGGKIAWAVGRALNRENDKENPQ